MEEKRFMAQWNALADGKQFMVKGKAGGTVNKLVWAERDWLNPGVGRNCVSIDVQSIRYGFKGVDAIAIAYRGVEVESLYG